MDIRKATYFDLKKEEEVYHGNYQVAKCAAAVQKYCTKDGDFLEIGDIDILQQKSAREGHQKVLGKRLRDGENIEDLIEEGYTQLIFGYAKLSNDVKCYREAIARNKPICEETIPNTFGIDMPLLIEKQKHYWLWSKQPNCGKTLFLKSLDEKYRCSWYNQVETFQSIHVDSQFILFDEYSTATLKVTSLNQMCDGTYQYPQKGGPAKTIAAYIIICGNKHPAEVYPNHWPFIQARFNVHELGVPPISSAPHELIKNKRDPTVSIPTI